MKIVAARSIVQGDGHDAAYRREAASFNIAHEAMEYSKKNAGMAPLIQQYGPLLEQLNLKSQPGTAQRQNP